MAIGFIGLGNVGRHLARSVLRGGHELVVHDLDAGAVAGLVADGAIGAASIAEVCASADTVITCLPSPAVIDAVVAAGGGVLDALSGREGTCWIDCSTNDRSETLRLAAVAAERGVAVLEAPVTGGVHMAARGEITVLVGGDDELRERQREVLDSLGSPVIHVGPLGSAATIKVITNMLALTHLVAAGEALMLAKRSGVDLATAFEVIKHSSGNSFVHETESQVILNGSYNINFTMDLAVKDLGFAMAFGRESGVPLDVAGHVYQTFIRAREAYGGSAWSPEVVRLLEDALSTDLRAPGFPEEIT